MVDVFVDNVTTFEAIVHTTIIEVHGKRVTSLVVDNITASITRDRRRFASSASSIHITCSIYILILFFVLEETIVVVVISIDSLVAETIDTTQCVTDLHALYEGFVLFIKLTIHGSQDILVHFRHNVQVLRHVCTEGHIELADVQDWLRRNKEFPTFVFHTTYVTVGNIRVTS